MPEEEVVSVARFRGPVTCAREPRGPLGLTLRGRTADPPGEELELAFAGAAPAEFPAHLEDAVIERAGPGRYRIASGAHAWTITARSVHLHRDVAQVFYRAIPPRPAPLLRRMAFGLMLTMARTRVGIALLKALRR